MTRNLLFWSQSLANDKNISPPRLQLSWVCFVSYCNVNGVVSNNNNRTYFSPITVLSSLSQALTS